MEDKNAAKEKLINELDQLRKRVAELEASETERKHTEEELNKSYTAIETSLNAVFTSDIEGKVVYANPAAARMWGFKSPKNMIGTNIIDYWSESSRLNAMEIINILGTIGLYSSSSGLIGKRKDGTEFLVEVKAAMMKDGTGRPVGMAGSFNDITERRQAEEKLQKSEEKYRSLIKNIPSVTWTADSEGKVTFISPNVEQVLGFTPDEVYNFEGERPWLKRVHSDDVERLKEAYDSLISENNIYDIEYRFQGKNGQWIWLHDKAVTIYKKDGMTYADGIFSDVTRRRQLEEQLQIRQKMDSLGTLAGGIAHDFNNLLAGIMGYLDVLINIDSEGLRDSQKEYVKKSLLSCNRAADLVKQFQSLSKGSVSEKTSVDLYEAVKEVFSLLEKTTDKLIDKKNDLKPEVFYVTANPSELNQVLLNLGTNAAKAIEERGTKPGDYIRIRAKEYNTTGIDRTGLTAGKYVHIFFEDNGIGMSDEVRKKVFDPLFTTRDKSTNKGQGLGLAMVYNIVTRYHNGRIDIESAEGKGTTFHIYLPKAQSRPQVKSKEVMGVVGGNEEVLIVEDEEMVLNLAEEVLQNYGYNVLTARDGRQGLEIFTENSNSIDIVLLDLAMPEMSGQVVLKEMLKINPDVKVIISSGYGDEDVRKGILSKAKGIVSKPYKTIDLAQTIRTVLDL